MSLNISPQTVLMIDDVQQQMLDEDNMHPTKRLMAEGLLPQGQISVFGDFTPHWYTGNPKCKSHDKQGFDPKTLLKTKKRIQRKHKFSNKQMQSCQIEPTKFRVFYCRGDLPIVVTHGQHNSVGWSVEIEKLDFNHYLPIFVDGIREKQEPYRFMAVQGQYDLVTRCPLKVLQCVPQLVEPMKKQMNTKQPDILCTVLKFWQEVLKGDPRCQKQFIPYFRQLLQTLNLFKDVNENIGDHMEMQQRKRLNIGDLIQETLELLETYQGEEQYVNIKYMIPTYESCQQ